MIENWEMMEKLENKKDFSFPHLCLIGRVEKWREEFFFYLVEKRNGRIEMENFFVCLFVFVLYKFTHMSLLKIMLN